MKHVLADDEATPEMLRDIDLARMARLLEQAGSQQGDAYDVLRGVLEQLSDPLHGRRPLN